MEVFSENIFWVKILNRVAWAIDCSETLNLEPTLCFCRFDYAETKFSGFLRNLSVFFNLEIMWEVFEWLIVENLKHCVPF